MSVLLYGDAHDLPVSAPPEQGWLQAAACPAPGNGGQEAGGAEAEADGLLQGTGSSARQPRDRRRALGGPTKQGGELGQTGGAEFESGLVFWPTGVHGSVLLEFLSPTKPSHGKHKGARRSEQEPSRTKSCVQIAVVYKKLALASPAIDFF